MPVREMNNPMWTKENVKKLLEIWESKTIVEVAVETGLSYKQVNYMAQALRNKGFKLSKKRIAGKLQSLLDEVAGELGITIDKK